MGQTIIAERDQTDVPIGVQVTRDGGIPGLTIEAKFFNGDDTTEWLDFDDGVFKSAGHTDDTLDVPEVNATEAPGLYAVDGGFDLSGITLPADTRSILVQYDITAGGETGTDTDTIDLVLDHKRIAFNVWDEILQGNTHNIQNSSGRILRQLKEGIGNVLDEGNFQAGGTTTSATLALTAPAVDASLPGSILVDNVQNTFWVIVAYDGTTKIATLAPDRGITPGTGNAYIVTGNVFGVLIGDQLNVVRDAIVNDATRFPGANINATISSRSSHSAADVDTVLTAAHGAGSWTSASPPTAAAIADAVLTELILDHAGTAGSLAEAIRFIKALTLGNHAFDMQSYNVATKFLKSGRIRLFDTGAAAAAATDGGSGEGEFATLTVDGTEHDLVLGQPKLTKVSID